MTVESAASAVEDAVLAAVVAQLREILGEGAVDIGPQSRLEEHLQLESVDLLDLAARLRARYGAEVDLDAYVRGLDIDAIIALSVADVAAYVCRTRSGT